MHACRVAVGLFFPGLVLLMSGRPGMISYAVIRSFTGGYGRAESRRFRLGQQAPADAVLLTGVGMGLPHLSDAGHLRDGRAVFQ